MMSFMKNRIFVYHQMVILCMCVCLGLFGCSNRKTSGKECTDVMLMEPESQGGDSVERNMQTVSEKVGDGVFKGTWLYKEYPEYLDEQRKQLSDPYIMSLRIDLYAKTIENGSGVNTYGGFYVSNGLHEGTGDIVSTRIEGNKAYIEYIDPACLTYSATLIYNSGTKQIEFVDGDIVDDVDTDAASRQAHRAIPVRRLLEMYVTPVPHPLSARKGLGIYGNAEKVVKAEKETILFDRAGNITSKIDSNNQVLTYYYDTKSTAYSIDGGSPYIITYSAHKRSDMSKDESDTEGSVEYLFDEQDRIIECKRQVRMAYVTETFTYTGTNLLPDSREVSDYDECGMYLTTDVYEYLEVDKQGNWLKRKVSRTHKVKEFGGDGEDIETTETEPVRIETQTIKYYD